MLSLGSLLLSLLLLIRRLFGGFGGSLGLFFSLLLRLLSRRLGLCSSFFRLLGSLSVLARALFKAKLEHVVEVGHRGGPRGGVFFRPIPSEGFDSLHERGIVSGNCFGIRSAFCERLTDAFTLRDEFGGFEEFPDNRRERFHESASKPVYRSESARFLLKRRREFLRLTLKFRHRLLERDVLLVRAIQGQITKHLDAFGEEVTEFLKVQLRVPIRVQPRENLREFRGIRRGGPGGNSQRARQALILGQSVEELTDGHRTVSVCVALLEDASDLGFLLLGPVGLLRPALGTRRRHLGRHVGRSVSFPFVFRACFSLAVRVVVVVVGRARANGRTIRALDSIE